LIVTSGTLTIVKGSPLSKDYSKNTRILVINGRSSSFITEKRYRLLLVEKRPMILIKEEINNLTIKGKN
jgi:hypothetical protein